MSPEGGGFFPCCGIGFFQHHDASNFQLVFRNPVWHGISKTSSRICRDWDSWKNARWRGWVHLVTPFEVQMEWREQDFLYISLYIWKFFTRKPYQNQQANSWTNPFSLGLCVRNSRSREIWVRYWRQGWEDSCSYRSDQKSKREFSWISFTPYLQNISFFRLPKDTMQEAHFIF